MLPQVLVIEGTDYTPFIRRAGLSWSRNDLDSEKTIRLKNTKIRRVKLGTKRKVSFELRGTASDLTREMLADLDTKLSRTIYSATYLDLHGVQTRRFYTSSFSVTLEEAGENGSVWNGAAFDMIEE